MRGGKNDGTCKKQRGFRLSVRIYSENCNLGSLGFSANGNDAAPSAIQSMAERGTAAAGGVLSRSRILVCAGRRKADAPGQHNKLACQIQQAPRPAAHQPSRIPAYNGLIALFQRCRFCVNLQEAGVRSSFDDLRYLQPCNRGSRPKERRYPGRYLFEKGVNF